MMFKNLERLVNTICITISIFVLRYININSSSDDDLSNVYLPYAKYTVHITHRLLQSFLCWQHIWTVTGDKEIYEAYESC